MSGLAGFAARLLEREGALVEVGEGTVEAVLPGPLADRLGVPEHATLVEADGIAARRLAYGSEMLEKLLALGTGRLMVGRGRMRAVPVKPESAVAAARAFVLRNGVSTAADVVPCQGARLCLHAAYILHGDERREGLVSACIAPRRGVVPGFEVDFGSLEPCCPVSLPSSSRREDAANALEACAMAARALAVPFLQGMERRLQRDRERLEGYFADLDADLARSAAAGRIGAEEAGSRRAALSRDRTAKLEALAGRSLLRVEVRPIAALVVAAPAFLVRVGLRRRKRAREIQLEYDCATRRLIAAVCESCGGPAPRPAACDDALHLLCESCAPRSDGRIFCAACGKRRAAGNGAE